MARLVEVGLATLLAFGITSCKSVENPTECPTTNDGVSQLVGGMPWNWKLIAEGKASPYWEFKSADPQLLHGSPRGLGAVYSRDAGSFLDSGQSVRSKTASYMCLTEPPK